jgi:hypothetical protein
VVSIVGICPRRYSKAACLTNFRKRRCSVYDPFEQAPKPNRTLIYMGACMIAGIRLAREKQVNVRVIPTIHAIEESVELAHDIFNRVFRKVPEKMTERNL